MQMSVLIPVRACIRLLPSSLAADLLEKRHLSLGPSSICMEVVGRGGIKDCKGLNTTRLTLSEIS